MAISYWCIANPWNKAVAIDEFGPGTLDGNPADGPSFDACGPAAIENAAAGYEGRLPNYSNVGHIRAEMISTGQWTLDATGASYPVSNPRTTGAIIYDVAQEIPHRGYVVEAFHDYQDAVLAESDVRTALAYKHASIWIVTNGQALAGNEHGILGHFVVIAGYGGDNAVGSSGKLYVLNSDIAGQHGTATGQWMDVGAFLLAQPHGYVVMAPPPPPPPPEPPEDENIAAAVQSLNQIKAAVDQGIASALAALTEAQGS